MNFYFFEIISFTVPGLRILNFITRPNHSHYLNMANGSAINQKENRGWGFFKHRILTRRWILVSPIIPSLRKGNIWARRQKIIVSTFSEATTSTDTIYGLLLGKISLKIRRTAVCFSQQISRIPISNLKIFPFGLKVRQQKRKIHLA